MDTRIKALIAAPLVVISGAIVGLATLGGDESATAAPQQITDERLTEANRACDGEAGTGATFAVELEDQGDTLLVDTNPEDTEVYTDRYHDSLECVLSELDTPQSIVSQIERTNSLQGVQEATHDGLEYSWTYHPDNGNEMIISLQRLMRVEN